MISIPYRCEIVVTKTELLYSTSNIGFKASRRELDEVVKYVFDASLVQSYRQATLFINGVPKEAVFVELQNSHDVCFLGSFDDFDKYFTELSHD